MLTIDARGRACPQPVIMARKEMLEHDELTVLVSGIDAVSNITRLAEKAGWSVKAEQRGDHYALELHKQSGAVEPAATPELEETCNLPGKAVVLVSGDKLGNGPDELGGILIKSFFYALSEVDEKPKTLVLINSGVTLATQDSPVLEAMHKLAAQGVEILVCGTCLGYLNLKEKLAVGTISNMYTIAETLLTAGHTITF
ncbi:MAG: sulfurtransferase-like selenium metabolism protein YedF [Anaerolineae bacterium]